LNVQIISEKIGDFNFFTILTKFGTFKEHLVIWQTFALLQCTIK